MGSAHSVPAEMRELADRTGFTSEQIEHLHRRFKQLSQDQLTIRKENFDSIPDLEFNPIRGKIVHAFFDKRNLRQESDGLAEEINFEDFLTIMSYFRPIEMNMDEEQLDRFRKEKLKFLFHMYDSDHDGKITLQEYRNVTWAPCFPTPPVPSLGLTPCLAGGGGAALREPPPGEGVGSVHRRRGHDGGSQHLCGTNGPGPGVRGHHLRGFPEDVAGNRHRDQDARPLPQRGHHRSLLLRTGSSSRRKRRRKRTQQQLHVLAPGSQLHGSAPPVCPFHAGAALCSLETSEAFICNKRYFSF